MRKILLTIITLLTVNSIYSQTFIPADDSRIQFYGRWDWSNPSAPSHSWPGVYVYAEFEGTSISGRFNDNFNYYNVFIDGEPVEVFHGTSSGTADYTLASGLTDGQHSILLTKRNEAGWASYSFHGFILDDGKTLLEPVGRPVRKIEFLGDSFTSASGNEALTIDAPDNVEKYTNVYEGFGPIIARHYDAQYHMTSISGIGLVLDWQGNYSGNLPDRFNRVNIQSSEPVWDFEQWIPNLVVLGLGLNDYSGFGGWDGNLVQDETDLYKTRYHEFIAIIRDAYPGVKILCVATHVEWMRTTIAEIVQEENEGGNEDVYYAQYSYYEGGYVNNGHPNVATHYGIADELINYIDTMDPWEPYVDNMPPVFTSVPESFISYDKDLEINVVTDSYSIVKYDLSDKSFDDMENTFTTTGRRNHVLDFTGEHGQEYTLYIRAQDLSGNSTTTSEVISFSIDTTKALLNWYDNGYNDADWNSGDALFGQTGGTGVITTINDANTVYFRNHIEIENPADISAFGILIKGSDAAAVYLNGTELGRINFADDNTLEYDTYAVQNASLNKMFVITDAELVSLLQSGVNIVSVEMHKSALEINGILFDSQMIDQANQVIYPLGSNWKFFDSGSIPESQLIDKTTSINDRESIPSEFRLYQNYPNPFNPSTTINYSISEAGHVQLGVYTITGEQVKNITDDFQRAGNYSLKFDGNGYSSGVYFYRLETNGRALTKAMYLIK